MRLVRPEPDARDVADGQLESARWSGSRSKGDGAHPPEARAARTAGPVKAWRTDCVAVGARQDITPSRSLDL